VASLDDCAVGISFSDGRNLTRAHGDHGFVQKRDAFGHLAQVDEAPAFTDTGESRQLWVVEATTDLHGFVKACLRANDISPEHEPKR
jgi:hypothetical protein